MSLIYKLIFNLCKEPNNFQVSLAFQIIKYCKMLPVVFITGNSFVDIRKSPYYCTSCNLYFL